MQDNNHNNNPTDVWQQGRLQRDRERESLHAPGGIYKVVLLLCPDIENASHINMNGAVTKTAAHVDINTSQGFTEKNAKNFQGQTKGKHTSKDQTASTVSFNSEPFALTVLALAFILLRLRMFVCVYELSGLIFYMVLRIELTQEYGHPLQTTFFCE